MKRFRRLALPTFVLLNVLDILSSWYDFQLGAQEGNPLLAPLLAQAGIGGLILFKVLLVLVVTTGVLLLEYLKARRVALFIMVVGILLGVLWVVSNVLQAILHAGSTSLIGQVLL